MDYLLVYILGILTGAGFFVAYSMYQINKLRKAKNALYEEIKKKAQEFDEKANSVKDRLIKASQIATAQNELRAQAEMPSKNALHSKLKNGIAAEIADMEQQKLDILRTILAEGFNPMITVIHDGGVKEEVPLSDYVAAAQMSADMYAGKKSSAATTPPPPPMIPEQPKKVGKFFIYKGGRDDGTSH